MTASLPEQIRDFNANLDLSSYESVLRQLGIDESRASVDAESQSFVIDAPFFGAVGRLRYAPKGFDGGASRLAFHANADNTIHLAKAALLSAFPAVIVIAASESPRVGVIVGDQRNVINFFAANMEAEELEITAITFNGRDGSGAFSDASDKLVAGASLMVDAIKTFCANVDLRSADDVVKRLGLPASELRWLKGDIECGCFHFSGTVFGNVGRLSHTRTIDGAELFFLIGEDRIPFISPAALKAAFPSLVPGRTTPTFLVREGANQIIFSTTNGAANPLLVTGVFFRTPRRPV